MRSMHATTSPTAMKKAWNAHKSRILAVLAVVGITAIVLLTPQPKTDSLRGAISFATNSVKFRIGVITDLDQTSKVPESKKPAWRSFLKIGTLTLDTDNKSIGVQWESDNELISKHNEAGRGMELSELIVFNDKLYSVDDRTGIVYEILDESVAYPRYILMEGDGNTDKGFKSEWATVKDGKLVVGSFGKEFTDSKGRIVNTNNNWVKVITDSGSIEHVDWNSNYAALRKITGTEFPGYLIHEAAAWGNEIQKWVFAPRRVSTDMYDDVLDEKRGSNVFIIADDSFENLEVRKVGTVTPERGFSSIKFVPGTHNQIIAALKSEENAEAQTQSSYIMVFTLDGKVLLPETEIPGGVKYEGLEFLPVT